MIQDLHNHTYYSFDSHDAPEDVIEAAIKGGVEVLGICDHNYGIGLQRPTTDFQDDPRRIRDYNRCIRAYHDHLRLLADRYKDKIRLLCGIEIATVPSKHRPLPQDVDVSMFDYCLVESIADPATTEPNIFAFAKRCGCRYTGIAHTDLFEYLVTSNQDPTRFFRRMAQENIFWEINVNYDSIHHYRQHEYVLKFLDSPQQQEIVRRSGVKLSVGFDGHRIEDYRPDILRDYCRKLQSLDLPLLEISLNEVAV